MKNVVFSLSENDASFLLEGIMNFPCTFWECYEKKISADNHDVEYIHNCKNEKHKPIKIIKIPGSKYDEK